MSRQVLKKWGNSPAVRIPAAVMEAAHLSLNQPVEVKVEGSQVIIEPAAPSYALDELVASITLENLHEAVDFGLPPGRELL